MLLYQWLREAAQRQGSTQALVYKDTYLSWRGVYERVERRALELQQMGIGEGHWVGLMLGNVPEFLILAGALTKLRALVVPLDPTTGSRELQTILQIVPMRALITRPRGGIDPTSSAPEKGGRITIPAPQEGIQPETRRRLQGTLLSCALYKRTHVPTIPSEATYLFLTSDKNGAPVGVFRTDSQQEAQQKAWQEAVSFPSQRMLMLVPCHTTYGFEQGLLATAYQGLTLYLEDEMLGSRVCKLIREQNIGLVLGTPRLFANLARGLLTPLPPPKSPVQFLSSEYPLLQEESRLFHERMGFWPFSLYRHTEAGLISLNTGGKEQHVGNALPGVEIRCEGRSEEKVEPIWVRSAWTCTHTLHAEGVHSQQQVAPEVGECTKEGWLRTGDVGWVTAQGVLFLQGREDDAVKLEHKRVLRSEVIRCLQQHPRVRSASVEVTRTVDDQVILTATVHCRGSCTEQELSDFCVRHLAPYKVPRRILVETNS